MTDTNETMEAFKHYVENALNGSKNVLKNFKEKLNVDAYDAFKWGDNAMEAAAKLYVYTIVKDRLLEDFTLQEIIGISMRESLRLSREVPKSSSVLDNLMHQQIAAIWCNLYCDWKK